ncbi:MAG: ABC transporter permease [Candidatus Poribacteria bacterium]|jgi:peptide/nickel transport system permease protein|nr:ABC transporter permease [Candidatus Poribacteria bacterium]MDP6997086.1 ABC transporter permease [Candidatus Poribacteria bacterium]
MTTYIIHRLLIAMPTLIAISIVSFIIIQLPKGDYLDRRIQELEEQYGDSSSMEMAAELRQRYGLDKSMPQRYLSWITGFVQGNFGESFRYEVEVNQLIWDRIGFTLLISIGSLFFTYIVAVPVGIYSATHQYKFSDNLLTLLSFVGMSIPAFLLALTLMVFAFELFGLPLFGLFSSYYEGAPWTVGKLGDLIQHLWIPVIVLGLNGTAGLMRIMRGNLLDVLGQPFIQTARAKGLKEWVVVVKHAVRLAINPLVSILGMSLPTILSGAAIVSVVLGLPTVGPLLLRSLLDEDIYLAGTLIMLLSSLLVIGNLLADIALAWVDPRIRYE